MTHRYLFLIPLVAATLTSAQQVDWLMSHPVQYDLNPDLAKHLVCATLDGGVNQARLDSSALVYGIDIYGRYAIELRDHDGILQWSLSLRDKLLVQSIATNTDGTVYACGLFMDDLVVGDDSLFGDGGLSTTHPFVLALDNTGQLLWMRDLHNVFPDAFEMPCIRFDADHHGWYSVNNFMTTTIVRFNELGEDVESRVIQGARMIGSFDFDPWNNLFVSGATGSGQPFTFGGLTSTVPQSYAMFVLRMDAIGNASWVRFAHDQSFQRPDVVADDEGNAFVAGSLIDSASFGNIHFNGPNWLYDMFITKVTANGDFVWGVESAPASLSITGDFLRSAGTCIAKGPSNLLYILGAVRGATDWGNGVVSDVITLGVRSQSVVCFDADGLAQWQVTGPPTGFFVAPQSICADSAGVIHCDTHVSGAFEFGGIIVNAGGQQAALAQITDGLATSMLEHHTSMELSAYPSPFADVLHVALQPNARNIRMRVVDASGRMVFDGAYTGSLGRDWSPGVYAITLITNDAQRTVRVVKE